MLAFRVRPRRDCLCLLVIAVKREPVPAATSLACKGSMTIKSSGSSSLSGVKVHSRRGGVDFPPFSPSEPRAESHRAPS